MKPMKPKEVMRLLIQNGWYEVPAVGGHRQFKHDSFPNKITVSFHHAEIKPKTLKSILKQAGLE